MKKTLNIPKGPYDAIKTEEEILKFWSENKFFKPEYHPETGLQSAEEFSKDKRESFCIINPPPNANGRPHIGHMSGYAYQDLMARYARMQGKKVAMIPGKDHAGIQTEAVFEREVLKPKGKTKFDLGRESFYRATYEFSTKASTWAKEDEKRIGLSADFDRDTFTLDPEVVNLVLETFIKLLNDGKVYKGVRIINWCPSCKTALADIDTEKKDRNAKLYYIRYPIVTGGYITVATTRPETMLGDTAVAVNPKDKRYKELIKNDAKLLLPLLNREIPFITTPKVEMEFGTGALKLTPAHAPEDYEIMKEWNASNPGKKIGYINIIDKDKNISGPTGKYKGLGVEEAREAVLKDLEELGLLEKIEELKQVVSTCERCKSVIEPIMSSEWYVAVEELKQPAIDAVKSGEIKIHPEYMKKRYLHWMENLREWPISRSLWWGYRFPVWYKGEKSEWIDENGIVREKIGNYEVKSEDNIKGLIKKGVMFVGIENPNSTTLSTSSSNDDLWIQDEDVFDTWFSSGQWAFVPLIKHGLISDFYPTSVMETMYDILELWVSRMIMLGIYHQGKVPFNDVYLHGMVLAEDGQKMSKSKGNTVSPKDIISEYGADALRLFYFIGNKAGGQYPVDRTKLKGNKNFLNKIWNSAKFVLINLEDLEDEDLLSYKKEDLTFVEQDIEMLNKLDKISKDTHRRISKFNFGVASAELYDSYWHDFCDWYLEEVKTRLYTKDREGNALEYDKKLRLSAQWMLYKSLDTYIKLLHPFVPFITERVWQLLGDVTGEDRANKSLVWERFE